MKAVRMFFSILFSMFFTFVLVIGIFLLSFNSMFSSENIKGLMKDINYEEIMSYDGGDIIDADDYFMNVPEVKELTERLFVSGIDYVFNGKNKPQITSEDIDKIVNSDYYKDELGIELTAAEKKEFAAELEKEYAIINQEFELELSEIRAEFFEDEAMQFMFSSSIKIAIGVILLILALLIVLCRWSLYRSLAWVGWSSISAAIITVLGGSAIKDVLLAEETDSSLISIMNNMFDSWSSSGMIFLTIGIALVVLYFVIRANIKNKTNVELELDVPDSN